MRDPYNFRGMELKVVEKLSVKRKFEGERGFSIHTPQVYSEEEFYEKLSEAGEIWRIEQYICSDTGIPVIRGSVKKLDNKEYFFSLYQHNNQILKREADLVVSCLTYSGRVAEIV